MQEISLFYVYFPGFDYTKKGSKCLLSQNNVFSSNRYSGEIGAKIEAKLQSERNFEKVPANGTKLLHALQNISFVIS